MLFWHRINWGSSWRSRESSKTVPKAINAAIWRLLIFFVGTIVVISSLLPYHLAGLSANDVSSSPFVTVFNYIGIPYAEDIIRFVIITALLSAANSGLFAASRMMWSLSAKINYLKFCETHAVWNTYYCHYCDNVWCYSGLLSEQFAPETILKICWVLLLLQWLLFGLQFVFRNLTSVDSGISQEKQ